MFAGGRPHRFCKGCCQVGLATKGGVHGNARNHARKGTATARVAGIVSQATVKPVLLQQWWGSMGWFVQSHLPCKACGTQTETPGHKEGSV